MAKPPPLDCRLRRSGDPTADFSIAYAIAEGGSGLLRIARAGGHPIGRAATAGDATSLTAAQLQATRFDVVWDGGNHCLSLGLGTLQGAEVEQLEPGTWYSLHPVQRQDSWGLELAREGGGLVLARGPIGQDLAPEGGDVDVFQEDLPTTAEPPARWEPAEVVVPASTRTPAAPIPAPTLEPVPRLVGPTSGALVRHLRRKQARDAREIARLRIELKRLHRLLKDADLSP